MAPHTRFLTLPPGAQARLVRGDRRRAHEAEAGSLASKPACRTGSRYASSTAVVRRRVTATRPRHDSDTPRQAEHEVHPVLFAPGHQRFAGETGVGAQQDAGPGPSRPDLRDDPRDVFDRARAAVDVRRPELGRQQMPAAEHIERQVAVAVIIAVKEPALLMAMQRVVGRVEVENDLSGRPCVRLEEEIDEQGFDRRRVVADLVIARGDLARQLQPVERRLARRRRAVAAPSLQLARQHRHQRVVPKLVVIVKVFVAERDAEHALPDERGDRVLDEPWVPRVAETSREPPNQIQTLVRRAQQQAACV